MYRCYCFIVYLHFCFMLGNVDSAIDKTEISWCIVTDKEQKKCNDLSAAVMSKKTHFGNDYLKLNCEKLHSIDDCMYQIDTGKTDIMSLDPGDIFIGGRYHSLIPIISEVYSDNENGYYAIAVIKNSSFGNLYSLESLKGKKACFPGIRSLSGWVIPVSHLIDKKIISVIDCNNQVNSVGNFFGISCAADVLSSKFNLLGENSHQMCDLCDSSDITTRCTINNRYAGFEGAINCLIEKGDIAFVNHNTINNMIKVDVLNYLHLLCLDGSSAPLNDFYNCNWGWVPSHAIVTSSAVSETYKKKMQDFFMTMFRLFDESHKENFQLFSSFEKYESYGLLFQDSTKYLKPVAEHDQSFEKYLKPSIEFIYKIRQCPVANLTLCVIGELEYSKCLKMKEALRAQLLKPDLICLNGYDSYDCMTNIAGRDADMVMLDAGDIYMAGQQFGLIPLLAEHYNLVTPNYYAVAVTKLENKYTDLLYLRGNNTCHGAINNAAGWIIPMAFLLNNKRIRSYGCNSLYAASQFFTKSCIPGAFNPHYNVGQRWNNLCDLCHGTSFKYCARDSSEPFHGHTGAFHCLVEGGGHVAFVKHTTVLENTEGKRNEFWARNQLKRDYELLCPDGTRKPVTEYENCNLGLIPSNALVIRGGSSYNDTEAKVIINLFTYAQHFYSRKEADQFSFRMFYSDPPFTDLIFQDACQQLSVIPENGRNYKTYLGEKFLRAKLLTDCTAGISGIKYSIKVVFIFITVTKLI